MLIARRALLVLERARALRLYVLYESPAPVYVPDLHAEAYRQERKPPRLRSLQDEHVRRVLERVDAPEARVRLPPVECRVYVRGASGKEHRVEPRHDRLYVVRLRYEGDVQGRAARGLH